jgi:hypothetical protein
MNRKRIFLTFTIITTVFIFPAEVSANLCNKSEVRGVFFHQISGGWSSGYDWSVMAQVLDDYDMNMCLIPSSTRWGFDEDFFDQAVNECHARGMEVHVIIGMFSGSAEDSQNNALDHNLQPVSWHSPCKPAVRSKIKSLVTDLFTNYDIDGFNFDYVRYDNEDMDYSPECKALFEEWLEGQGLLPIGSEWPGEFAPSGSRNAEFMEWRLVPITDLVRETRDWILDINPNVEFSADVWNYYQSFDKWRWTIGQDGPYWVVKDYLDFVSPMIYRDDMTIFESKLDKSIEWFVGDNEGNIPIPIFITTGGAENRQYDTNIFKQQIDMLRERADGWIIWRYGGPGAGSHDALFDMRPYVNKINETDPDGWFEVFEIQNLRVERVDGDSVEIKWDTTKPTTSKVEYSTSYLFPASKQPGLYFEYWDIDYLPGTMIEDGANVTSHSITIDGLQDGEVYYYRAQSKDDYGTVTTKLYSFTVGEYLVNLTGIVSNSSSGSPIRRATVTCGEYSAMTDASGIYSIHMVSAAPTSCDLVIEKADYKTKTVILSFPNNGKYTQDVALDSLSVHKNSVSGRLIDDGGQPVEATVKIYEEGTQTEVASAQTSDGNYDFDIIPGVYDIEFEVSNLYIPNYKVKLRSADVNFDLYNTIKSVTDNPGENKVSIVVDIDLPKTLEIYTESEPQRIFQNGTELVKVPALGDLRNSKWHYDNSTAKKLYLIATPWPAPVCGNDVCEKGEDYNNCLEDCPVDAFLVGYWSFDEGSGNTATDGSGNGNDGQLQGGLDTTGWRTNCISGSCLDFDGNNDYVSVEPFGDFTDGYTIEFWFKMRQDADTQRPFWSNYFTTCFINSGSTSFACYIGDGTVWSTSLYTPDWNYDAWTHYAMTYDPVTGESIVYRNGTNVGSKTYDKIMEMTNPFYIGSSFANFNGIIDEFKIYNYTLDEATIQSHASI